MFWVHLYSPVHELDPIKIRAAMFWVNLDSPVHELVPIKIRTAMFCGVVIKPTRVFRRKGLNLMSRSNKEQN